MPNDRQLVALCLRHGQTSLNDSNCFRSWLDVPLDDTGIKQAQEAAEFLSKYAIRNVICSPLLRAFVTASTVAAPHNLSIGQTRGLFPWHLGLMAGLSKEEYQDALRLFVDNPDVCIPNGESLNDFEDRQFAFWNVALKHAQDTGLTLFVAHTSNIIALQSFTDHTRSLEPEDADTVKPGGIVAVYFDGTHHFLEPIFGKAEEAVFGGS
jgi:broad specificity phosphatase PhoE